MRGTNIIFCILIALITVTGCHNISRKKIKNEGEIVYSISYDDSLDPKFNQKLLPTQITVKFNGKNTFNKIEGLNGAVTLTYIQNYNDKTRLVLIKLFSKNMYYQEPLNDNDSLTAFAGMPDINLQGKGENVDFMGYDCTKVKAIFKDSANTPFEIIYTKEIDVSNPNTNTPFEMIDGVMFKFKIILYNRLLTIRASKISSMSIPMEEFNIPSGYEKVPRKTIEDVISLVQ